ncbi:MAG: DnaD domain protein, partial [Oscillospiraceae bacterium]
MNFKVNWSCSDGAFAVPDCAVDNIKLASGKAVKVLFYIMRYKTAATENAADIALQLDKNMTAEDVEDSLSFWEQVGVICPTDSAASAPTQKNGASAENNSAQLSSKQTISSEKAVERAVKMLSPSEISEKVKNSQNIAFLLSGAESILGKPLNNTEQRTLIWLTEYYSLGCDILLMLLEFCKSINKTNIGYIEKIAVSWFENDITTHERADAEIKRLQVYYSLEGKIKSRLELNRALTPKEKEIVTGWVTDGVSIELVEAAYERTVQATGKASFPYMKKIIENWLINNIRTPADAEKFEQSRNASAQTSDNDTHSYDIDKLLKFAKNNIPNLKGD